MTRSHTRRLRIPSPWPTPAGVSGPDQSRGGDRGGLASGGLGAGALVYRRDAFERSENQEAAAEAGVTLEPPETYEALDALAGFFQGRDWDGDGRSSRALPWHLAARAPGTSTWRPTWARTAALGLHPDYYAFLFSDDTMAPCRRATVVEALTGLAGPAAAGPRGQDVRRRVRPRQRSGGVRSP